MLIDSVVSDSLKTPCTVAGQAPLSMGFLRKEYWSSLPFPTPGEFPDPEIESVSLVSPALASRFFTTEPPGNSMANTSVQISLSVMSDSLQPHELQHARTPCPSPTPRVHSDSRPSGQ